jgi:DNA-binding transcriptional regulator/RsmH inhibitor MraZ
LLLLIPILLINLNLSPYMPHITTISKFRTSYNESIQRLVIDTNKDKKPCFTYNEEKNLIILEARMTSFNINKIKKEFNKKHYINKIDILNLNKEGEVFISLSLKENTKIKRVFSLSNPGRVVIDIKGQ